MAGRLVPMVVLAVLAACASISNPLAPKVAPSDSVEWAIMYQNYSSTDYSLWMKDAGDHFGGSLLAACADAGMGGVVLEAPFAVYFGPGSLEDTEPSGPPGGASPGLPRVPLLFTSESLPAAPGAAGYNLVIAKDGSLSWTPLAMVPPEEFPPPLC